MDLKKHVKDILTPVIAGKPLAYRVRSKDRPCVSYHFFNIRPSLHGDGKVKRKECQCQVDIWTDNGDHLTLADAITGAMLKAGWLYVGEDDEVDTTIGVYQNTIVFYLDYKMEVADGK